MTVLDLITSVPQIKPPRYSLLSVAAVDSRIDERFGAGLTWEPEPFRYEGGGDLGAWLITGANTPVSGASVTQAATGAAFGVYAAERITGISADWDDLVSRVQRKLAVYESSAVAMQLMGDIFSINPSGKIAHTSAATNAGSGSIPDAVGLLDAHIGIRWGRGMLHISPTVLANGLAQQVFTREGNVYLTPMGNVVVADVGYSGLSPVGAGTPGADEYLYATPEVVVNRSAMTVTPGNLYEATDRLRNDITVYAFRIFAPIWDYQDGSAYARATF